MFLGLPAAYSLTVGSYPGVCQFPVELSAMFDTNCLIAKVTSKHAHWFLQNRIKLSMHEVTESTPDMKHC